MLFTGGTAQPTLNVDISSGFTLGLSVPSGLQFRLVPPNGHDVALVVDMSWCSSGTWPDSSPIIDLAVNTSTTVILHNMRAANGVVTEQQELSLEPDYTSMVVDAGRCFALRGRSTLSSTGGILAFDGLSIQLDTSGLTVAGTRTLYSPVVQGGGITMQYIRKPSAAVRTDVDPGVGLFVNDNQPPKIINCPGNIVITAQPGKIEAAVPWTNPLASDNVKVISMSSPTPAGSTFTVVNSPHIVTYTATDSSGLTAQCVFNVTVLHERLEARMELAVSGAIARSNYTSRFGMSQHSDALLHNLSFSTPPTLAVPAAQQVTTLAVDVIGNSQQQFAVRPNVTAGATAVRLEVDLQFRVDGAVAASRIPLAFASLEFINPSVLNGSGSPPAWTSDPKWFSNNEVTTVFDLASGNVRLSGVSRSFSEHFKFAGLRVLLSMPDNTPASSSYTL